MVCLCNALVRLAIDGLASVNDGNVWCAMHSRATPGNNSAWQVLLIFPFVVRNFVIHNFTKWPLIKQDGVNPRPPDEGIGAV